MNTTKQENMDNNTRDTLAYLFNNPGMRLYNGKTYCRFDSVFRSFSENSEIMLDELRKHGYSFEWKEETEWDGHKSHRYSIVVIRSPLSADDRFANHKLGKCVAPDDKFRFVKLCRVCRDVNGHFVNKTAPGSFMQILDVFTDKVCLGDKYSETVDLVLPNDPLFVFLT